MSEMQRSISSGSARSRITVLVLVILVAYWCILFYGTHMPLPPGALPGGSDKVIHFVAYGLLAFLFISLRATRGSIRWYSVVFRWLFLAGYGAFDELTQLLVKRSADLHDWYADVAGATVGFAVFLIGYGIWKRANGAQLPLPDCNEEPQNSMPNLS